MHHKQMEVKLLFLVTVAILTVWSVLTEAVAEEVVFHHSRYEKKF